MLDLRTVPDAPSPARAEQLHPAEPSFFLFFLPLFNFFFSFSLFFLFFFPFLVADYLQGGFGAAEPGCMSQVREDHLSVRGQQTALRAPGFQRHHRKLLGLGQRTAASTPATLPRRPRAGFFSETFVACGAQVHSTPSE